MGLLLRLVFSKSSFSETFRSWHLGFLHNMTLKDFTLCLGNNLLNSVVLFLWYNVSPNYGFRGI